MNFSALYRILVRFGQVTLEFALLKETTFAVIRQKSAYHAKYLAISWTDHYKLYRFGRHILRDDYPDIRLAVAQGTLLWQPVKFVLEDVRRHSHNDLYTLHFGVRQRVG